MQCLDGVGEDASSVQSSVLFSTSILSGTRPTKRNSADPPTVRFDVCQWGHRLLIGDEPPFPSRSASTNGQFANPDLQPAAG
jgi:hypothetical protein